MRSGSSAAVALTAAAAFGLAAPTAMASVTPNPAAPGQTLRITDDRRCDMSQGATVSSPLFGDYQLSAGADRMVGAVTTRASDRPGSYPLTIRCGHYGPQFSSSVTLKGAALTERPSPGASPGASPYTSEPTKGAKAGAGTDGWDSARTAGGIALLALAGGGALAVARRRANGKG